MSRLPEHERRRRANVLRLIISDLEGGTPEKSPGPPSLEYRALLGLKHREFITPNGAIKLFGKASTTIRRAVQKGRVTAPASLRFSDKPVRLIRLDSAIGYWGPPEADLLDEMRAGGHIMRMGPDDWIIINDGPAYLREKCDA